MSVNADYKRVPTNGTAVDPGEQLDPESITLNAVSKNGSPMHNPQKPGSESVEAAPEVKTKEPKEKPKLVGVFEVFRFSDGLDKFLIFVGSVCAIIHGAMLPSLMIVFGEMIEFFVDTGRLERFLNKIPVFLDSVNATKGFILADIRRLGPYCPGIQVFYNDTISCAEISVEDKILDEMTTYAIYFVIIASGLLVVAYLQMMCWTVAAERQAHRIRCACLRNILYQDIGWFDTHEVAELNTRLSDDIIKIQEGIGEKVGSILQWVSCFIAGFAIGFVYGWKLTLVILAVSPLLAGSAGVMGKLLATLTSKELEAYAKAGSVAEEVFSSIKTVISFAGQDKEVERYRGRLDEAYNFGVKKGFTNGALMGVIWCVVYWVFALGFWYSGKLFREDDEYNVSNVIVVFFGVVTAAFGIGNASPGIQAMGTGRGAAYVIFDLIDMKSKLNSDSDEGEKLSSIRGCIEFRDIHFNYPSRPDVKILNGLNIKAMPGQKVALIGSSGCGKSTVMQLLLRFYDPAHGNVLIDDKDIKDLNLKWFRQSIGLVSQEPILFATSIAENIRYGREDVTMEEMIEATKNANAYDFIKQLPQEFETFVGEQGAQLSGGQKQRLAIARALVRNPKILLLDEATSALDTESESVVQDALDKASEGRTTLIIAHRLSTIKNADIIVGFDQGKIVEQGSHDELMKKQGLYYQLVTTQQLDKTSEEDEEEIVDKKELELSRSLSRSLSNPTAAKETDVAVKDDKEKEDLPPAPFGRLMKLNGPEWHFILLGCLGALVNGGTQPAFAILFSEFFNVFTLPNDEMKDKMALYALLFVAVGIVSLLTMFLQGYMFARSGESLTRRLRDSSFRSMLRQDIAWYDDDKNSIGALTTRLATDASLVQGVTGVRLGSVFMSLANIGTAIIIAFIYGWQMSLLIIGFVPFFVLSGFVQVKQQDSQSGRIRAALEGAGKVTVECLSNIRTVASLTKEEMFFNLYVKKLIEPKKSGMRNAHIIGAVFGFSEAIIYYAYAGCFTFGAYMIEEGEMDFHSVFLVFSVLVFGAMGLGNATAFVPDAGKAKISAQRILMILDSQPSLDYTTTEGEQLPESYTSVVTFKDVHFNYPTRKTVPVLRGLNFSVAPGKTVALVGSSGCGKSTSVQLVERFYDTDSGQVCVDNHDIKSLNIQWLRSQIGVVSQEPVLFDRSIAENIAYGDNRRIITMDEIIEAARGANIHGFISSLPDGYDTNVGPKGTQLSGGQKQRVAIARALIRNPKILLLDEATSALDSESEQIVQEALDKAREHRTCIVIAHRLSTIRNVDEIYVISHGKVSEVGTHSELMAKQGFYHKLVKKSTKQT